MEVRGLSWLIGYDHLAGHRYKVVLDTNVVIAAARSRAGASAELLRQLVSDAYDIAVSAPLVFEYEEVLVRECVPAFMSLDDVDQLIRFVCHVGEKHQPSGGLRPAIVDADDEFLIELAVAARIDYLVTHNSSHFSEARKLGVNVITPGGFLKSLRANI